MSPGQTKTHGLVTKVHSTVNPQQRALGIVKIGVTDHLSPCAIVLDTRICANQSGQILGQGRKDMINHCRRDACSGKAS
jgi:hypothetical protein